MKFAPNAILAAPVRRNLAIGIAISVGLHAAVLAIRFQAVAPPPAPQLPNLEVVLLNLRTEDTPERVTALAQTASAGGGLQEAGLARSPLPAWLEDPQLPAEALIEAGAESETEAEAAAEAPLQAGERELLTHEEADAAVRVTPGAAEPAATPVAEPEPGTADLALIARLAQQYAAISQRLEDASQQPRQHYFAPSTSPWAFAEYVEQWRDAIETQGNRHYPPQLRGRLYGSLQLTVRIRADGTLLDIEFDTPSIHPEINDAARAIVQRAAPFAAFPDSLRREADVLSITRTWHFENDAFITQAP